MAGTCKGATASESAPAPLDPAGGRVVGGRGWGRDVPRVIMHDHDGGYDDGAP